MNPAHECLYDVDWQCRRLTYARSWQTEDGTRASISDMLTYIGRQKDPYWRFIRIWRCLNLVGTAIATAEKYENAGGLKLLKTFRKGLEIEYERHKGRHHRGPLFHAWKWSRVTADLLKLYIDDRQMFKQLREYSE